MGASCRFARSLGRSVARSQVVSVQGVVSGGQAACRSVKQSRTASLFFFLFSPPRGCREDRRGLRPQVQVQECVV